MVLIMDMVAFVHSSRLDKPGFYHLLQEAGLPDLSTNPFASCVFESYLKGRSTIDVGTALAAVATFSVLAEDVPASGWTRDELEAVLRNPNQQEVMVSRFERLLNRLETLENGGRPQGTSGLTFPERLGEEGLESWRREASRIRKAYELFKIGATGETWERFQKHLDIDEIFARYDVDEQGVLAHDKAVMMLIVTGIFQKVFAEFADPQKPVLDMKQFMKAIRALSFGEAPREAPAYLFAKYKNEQGEQEGIDSWEFVTGCARMIRPIQLRQQATQLPGWPGLPCFQKGADKDRIIQDYQAFEETLQTGDIFAMSLVDDSARYFNFVVNTIWTHVGIVLRHKRGPRPGVPNLETEEMLKDAAFRWRTHRFCTPRYCSCFASDTIEETTTELLEATGQGVHVYNLGARMFLGFNATRTGTLVVRRLKRAPGRDNDRKIESFIRKVRGHLYQVKEDDGSFFCSQLATAFLRDMGWLSPDAKRDHDYTPADYAEANVPLAGGAEWGEMEMIRNQWTGSTLPLQYSKLQGNAGASRVRPSKL